MSADHSQKMDPSIAPRRPNLLQAFAQQIAAPKRRRPSDSQGNLLGPRAQILRALLGCRRFSNKDVSPTEQLSASIFFVSNTQVIL
jgi:hypothetical protein